MCLSWSPASLFSRCVSICSNNAISNALEPHNLALGGVSPQFQNTRPYYAVIAWLMAVFNPITVGHALWIHDLPYLCWGGGSCACWVVHPRALDVWGCGCCSTNCIVRYPPSSSSSTVCHNVLLSGLDFF